MPIETGFILAAGFGTRMGKIGKVLPKVLWPIFDSTLLGLQIHFLKEIGIKKIYINAHHQKDNVIEYCKNNHPDVTILIEDDILDAGGGVHNFINTSNIKTPFIVLNSDQYFAVDNNEIKKKLVLPDGKRAKIFTMMGSPDYSTIELNSSGDMLGISNTGHGPMFIGLSIINPNGLEKSFGRSRFFESVCNFKLEQVNVENLDGEFLDFGELKKYQSSCFKLCNYLLNNHEILESWHKHNLVKIERLDGLSYNTSYKNVLNFSGLNITQNYPEGSVVIKESNEKLKVKKCSVVYEATIEEIN